jgi:hypothetical protein
VGAGCAHEKAMHPRPTSAGQVPPSPESLTRQWLTEAVCESVDAAVTSFDVEPISMGSTCRSRLSLSYQGDAAAVSPLPATVFVKSTARIGPSAPIVARTDETARENPARTGQAVVDLENFRTLDR